ncbi:MAG: hypothetical protein RR140_01390 [Clostridia bacterium]
MNTIAEVGISRLEKVLVQDKTKNPNFVCQVLRSDIKQLMNNYAEVDGDIFVDVSLTETGYNFFIKCSARRLKSFGSLPERL